MWTEELQVYDTIGLFSHILSSFSWAVRQYIYIEQIGPGIKNDIFVQGCQYLR